MEAIVETLRRLYKEATPSRNYDRMVETGETRKPNFNVFYYLPREKREQIIEQTLSEFRMRKAERELARRIVEDRAPIDDKKAWREVRDVNERD